MVQTYRRRVVHSPTLVRCTQTSTALSLSESGTHLQMKKRDYDRLIFRHSFKAMGCMFAARLPNVPSVFFFFLRFAAIQAIVYIVRSAVFFPCAYFRSALGATAVSGVVARTSQQRRPPRSRRRGQQSRRL